MGHAAESPRGDPESTRFLPTKPFPAREIGPGARTEALGRKGAGRGRGAGWEDLAAAKTRAGWLCGRWVGPQGGPSRLLPEYEQLFPGPGPAAPLPNRELSPRRATAAGHVIRANMAAAAGGS